MKSKKFSIYNALIRHLKQNLPLKHKVEVRRMYVSRKICGDCSFSKDRFLIRINKNLSEDLAIETAIHEFGHVLCWDNVGDDHGLHWGKAYSIVYREFLTWNNLIIAQIAN